MKLFPPGYQFLDANGAPVSSGTVNFYENGTTTDKGIFTDADLSVAATNPAPLNSAGRFNQGDLYGNGTYTVVLKDSAGTQIWSRDDFTMLQMEGQGADIASANALAVDIVGTFHDVTGTTQITSLNATGVGVLKILQFDGALTLTHHATDLILPGGANITTAAGDIAVFYEYASADWRCIAYAGNNGNFNTITAQGIVSVDDTTASTSGTTGSIHTDGGIGVAGTSYFAAGVTLSGTIGVGRAFSTTVDLYVEGAAGSTYIFAIDDTGGTPMVQSGDTGQTYSGTPNAADAVLKVYQDSTTSRSINSAGSNNASGADYAEYERKSLTCGKVEKGDVIGFDKDGLITDKFSECLSFAIKSTNPSYVGGDVWDDGLIASKPRAPEFQEPEKDKEKAKRDYLSSDGYQDYLKKMQLWRSELEKKREPVDRIAYAGKTPCNVTGDPGDTVIATQGPNDTILPVAVKTPTFEQYRMSVGTIHSIQDKPIVIVKMG